MTPIDILKRCIEVLQRHAPPDGLTDREALSELYSILDGPDCRRVLNHPGIRQSPNLN